MGMKKFDLVVLGGGTAGLTIAEEAAAHGWETALVEERALGGTCVNDGCIPTKTLIHSAKVMRYVRRARAYGINTAPPTVDWPAVAGRKDALVRDMRANIQQSINANKRIRFFEGSAVFEAPNRISVGDDLLTGEKVIICTGAKTQIPPVKGLNEVPYLTSTTALELQQLPESLVMIGGGIIAVEFAQMFAAFGVQVTILQRSPRIIPNVEPELSAGIHAILERDRVNIIAGAEIKAVQRDKNRIQVSLAVPDGEKNLTADQLMVATGRAPNTDRLQLDKAGVETDKRGSIKVDHAFRTSVPGIWALGDVTGGAMFTHRSWHDGFLLTRHFFKGETISTQARLIPYAIFTDPEIAAAGLGEDAAREKGHAVKTLSQPFKYVARAMAMAEEDGLVKLVVDEKTDALLGAHILGPAAGELIHELVTAIRFGAKLFDLQDMVHIHPTLAEGINSAALS